MENSITKIAILSTGLSTYWNQFGGLKERLEEQHKLIVDKLAGRGTEIISCGMVDSIETAEHAAMIIQAEQADLILIHTATYSLSSTLIPVIKSISVPCLILCLQPSSSIDFDYINSLDDRGTMTGEWLAYCQACNIPELACVLNRTSVRYDIIVGHMQDEKVWAELGEWLMAAEVVLNIRRMNLGILGHYYCGMLDVYTDTKRLSTDFGLNVKLLEMCELKGYRDAVTDKEISSKINEMQEAFRVDPSCGESEIERAARTSIALDKLVDNNSLGALAYYYEGYQGNDYEKMITSFIPGCTLLTGNGYPVAGECEVKNAMAMKIMSLLGAGGSFSEIYAIDFDDDVVLLGHDGPANYRQAEGIVGLVPLMQYHGKPGIGLSIQMKVKPGPVTLLSLCEDNDGLKLIYSEAEAVDGKTLQIGNTNSRYRFSQGAKEFIRNWSKAGPSHHCAIGSGHLGNTLDKIAFMANIRTQRI